MAVAAGTGRIGYVLFVGKTLKHWAMSGKASRSPEFAAAQAKRWIDELRPDVVITEKIPEGSRKGERTRQVIAAVARVARNRVLNDIVLPRIRTYKNKYEEAAALAKRFPEIGPWMPKRPPIWESEPRNAVYIDALALALGIIDGSPHQF
ncbi:hypothetical protein GGD81_001869 [Rhodobium orientis]|nr:hypothetical protein [Rhodobium orientis]MBB4302833.1 hypothetical protein [Rhodobium orientis]